MVTRSYRTISPSSTDDQETMATQQPAVDSVAMEARPPSPSTFLSPRITADLEKNLDVIEELFLLDDDGDGPASPQAQGTALAPNPNTTLNTTTPTTKTAKSSGVEVKTLANNYSLTNAVHMEVQENAKLPSFNLPVDRSNASWHIPAPRGRRSRSLAKRSRPRSSSGDGDSSSVSTANTATNNASSASHHHPEPASPIPKLRHHDHESTHHGPMESATSLAIDEIMRLNENDMNLSELFLDGQDRSNAALAYSYSRGMPQLPLGTSLPETSLYGKAKDALKNGTQHIGVRSPVRPHPITTSIPYNRSRPLPIPTLKKPSPTRGQNVAAAAAVATAAAIANRTSPTNTVAPLGGIDRQTAAALSVQPTNATGVVSNPLQPRTTPIAVPPAKGAAPPVRLNNIPPPPNLPPRSTPIPTKAPTFVPRPGTTIPRPTGPPPIPAPRIPAVRPPIMKPPHHYPPGHPYSAQAQAKARQIASLHAAAHAKTKASIAHATVQRSKFGFGGDHKVPSVPAPPPNIRGYPAKRPVPPVKATPISAPPSAATVAAAAAAAAAGKPSEVQPKGTPEPSIVGLPKDVSSEVAYERKKQRAKDARVKLNEAIEDLAVAIDLAGSQSKERFNYIVKTTNCANPHVTSSESSTASAPPIPQHPLAKLMDETIQQASDAKKWDRPSFVGLSATIIRSLNAQCEGLMREVAQLRNLARSQMAGDKVTSGAVPLLHQSSPVRVNGVNHSPPVGVRTSPHAAPLPAHAPNAAKKQKLDHAPNHANEAAVASQIATAMAMTEHQRCTAIRNTMGTPNLLKNIVSFLDPATLCKCLCVSKRWRSQNIFQDPELWLNLCVKRFGASAVRKWQDPDEDGTKKRKKAQVDANLNLYHRMSEKNIKPHCQMEGTIFLGGSSLDGLVSCWVSLMDRSNGETSRSVMHQKIQNGQKYYAPLPVVELRLLVQNTGYSKGVIIIPDQQFSVDASTRRKGEKMLEVSGDDRFKRQALHIERSPSPGEPDPQQQQALSHEMCHLRLYETAVLSVHIHARGCSTTAKFCNRAKKIQLLVSIDGTTRPLSIPFHCSNEHQLKQIAH